MKLELKHLAPYLPYGLKIQGQTHKDIEELSCVTETSINIVGRGFTYGMWADIFDIKPILRPLSDLKNEFTCPEGVVMPVGYFYSYADKVGKGHISEVMINLSALEYRYLLKYHFDVFGLIDKGLAIDINTL